MFNHTFTTNEPLCNYNSVSARPSHRCGPIRLASHRFNIFLMPKNYGTERLNVDRRAVALLNHKKVSHAAGKFFGNGSAYCSGCSIDVLTVCQLSTKQTESHILRWDRRSACRKFIHIFLVANICMHVYATHFRRNCTTNYNAKLKQLLARVRLWRAHYSRSAAVHL